MSILNVLISSLHLFGRQRPLRKFRLTEPWLGPKTTPQRHIFGLPVALQSSLPWANFARNRYLRLFGPLSPESPQPLLQRILLLGRRLGGLLDRIDLARRRLV